eukprot:2048571-Lingulodinium_polyedra.AAC.1
MFSSFGRTAILEVGPDDAERVAGGRSKGESLTRARLTASSRGDRSTVLSWSGPVGQQFV